MLNVVLLVRGGAVRRAMPPGSRGAPAETGRVTSPTARRARRPRRAPATTRRRAGGRLRHRSRRPAGAARAGRRPSADSGRSCAPSPAPPARRCAGPAARRARRAEQQAVAGREAVLRRAHPGEILLDAQGPHDPRGQCSRVPSARRTIGRGCPAVIQRRRCVLGSRHRNDGRHEGVPAQPLLLRRPAIAPTAASSPPVTPRGAQGADGDGRQGAASLSVHARAARPRSAWSMKSPATSYPGSTPASSAPLTRAILGEEVLLHLGRRPGCLWQRGGTTPR